MKKVLNKLLFVTIVLFALLFLNKPIVAQAATLYNIKVNYEANVVTIYDQNGTPIKAMVCSCGVATPKGGTYKLDYKYRWLALVGGVHGQYCSRIVGNILFHSVPYLQSGNPGSLEYWEYDKLGTSASAGCIRLTVEDAKWIYDNCASGTTVEFYASPDAGPLGKPEAMKISDSPNRDWDPTDLTEGNPWRDISTLFNYKYYADINGDLKAVYGYDANALKSHFLAYGINEGRAASPIFDVKYYLESNPDLKAAFGNNYYLAYRHYIECGKYEKRRASSIFDLNFYRTYNADLSFMSDTDLINHYINFGMNEGRLAIMPKEMFDYKYYADVNGDLKAAFGYDEGQLVNHWNTYGMKEGRKASSTFDVKVYRNNYKDLDNAFGNNYELYFKHYLEYGKKENRVAV